MKYLFSESEFLVFPHCVDIVLALIITDFLSLIEKFSNFHTVSKAIPSLRVYYYLIKIIKFVDPHFINNFSVFEKSVQKE